MKFLKIGHVSNAEFSNLLRRVIWGRILRGRHHGTRLWNSVDAKWLWRILQSMMPKMMKAFMTQFSQFGVNMHRAGGTDLGKNKV